MDDHSTITTYPTSNLGYACTVIWNPKSADYFFALKFSLGEWSHTTDFIYPKTTYAYAYKDYVIPKAVANQFPNAKSGTMTITLYTYTKFDTSANPTLLGADTKTTTVVLPENDSTKPSITMTLSPETPYEKFASLYLQGISSVKATIDAEGKYGATIATRSVQVEGKKYTNPLVSDLLTVSGELDVVGTVTDSRGYSNSITQKINVIAYKAPYISPSSGSTKVICERCTEDGTADASGTYLHVKGKRNYTKINTNGIVNTCSVRCRYKPEGGNWSHDSRQGVIVIEASNTATDEFDVVLPNVVSNVQLTYVVELNISDDTGLTSFLQFRIASEAVDFELRYGGKGAAFGKHSTKEKRLECEWDFQFNSKIYYRDTEANIVIEQGTMGEWNYRKWLDGTAECWARRSLNVNIKDQWGAIYYGMVDNFAFPTELFISAPICQATVEPGSLLQVAWVATSGKATTESAPAVLVCCPVTEEAGFDILYYAFGNWK